MPSKSRQKSRARPAPKQAPAAKSSPKKKPAPAPAKKPASKPSRPGAAKSSSKSGAVPAPPLEVPLPDGRRHVLSLSFVRDGDEFLARLETDTGHITELKNRSLDQLLTLVASELEDLLE
jgi:hypothetical protein